jgi:hypothetical protein
MSNKIRAILKFFLLVMRANQNVQLFIVLKLTLAVGRPSVDTFNGGVSYAFIFSFR